MCMWNLYVKFVCVKDFVIVLVEALPELKWTGFVIVVIYYEWVCWTDFDSPVKLSFCIDVLLYFAKTSLPKILQHKVNISIFGTCQKQRFNIVISKWVFFYKKNVWKCLVWSILSWWNDAENWWVFVGCSVWAVLNG